MASIDLQQVGKQQLRSTRLEATYLIINGRIAEHYEFWSKTIEANPDLKNAIQAISAGIFLLAVSGRKLTWTMDGYSGVAEIPPGVAPFVCTGRGTPLPPLPDHGIFVLVLADSTLDLTLETDTGIRLVEWNSRYGTPGLKGTFSGTWKKIGASQA